MTPEERDVEDALRTLRRQADECVSCLYAYLTIQYVASREALVRRHINANAHFWNTTLQALVTAAIVALGRVYETSTPHNLATFLQIMNRNRMVFSRQSLRQRKSRIFQDDNAGLVTYMRGTRAPSPRDYRRLRRSIARHRTTYQNVYRDLRDNLFAHTLTTDPAEIRAMYSATNSRQLQRMTTFLIHVCEAFGGTYHNGGRLTARPRRYSIARILRHPPGQRAVASVQEMTIVQTARAIRSTTIEAT